MGILRKFRESIRPYPYEPLIEVCILRESLLHNLEVFRKLSPKIQVVPVLKGNAYGHGLVEVGRIMDEVGAPFIVVDSLYEAHVLRKAGIRSKLLVIGYTAAENIPTCELNNVAFTLTGIEHVRETCVALRKKTSFHVKVDTGMHRQGLLLSDIPGAVSLLKDCRYANVEGVCSHLGDADEIDGGRTPSQIEAWHRAVVKLEEAFPDMKYRHLSNTAGAAYVETLKANVLRLGIGLYGVNPSPLLKLSLKPALEMRTRIASIRTIEAGESVGYNATFTATKPMRSATVPVGYYEGVDRRLSNQGSFLVQGKSCPIIGRVSMNITTIDVSDLPKAKAGDEVIVISASAEDPNSVENIARVCGTIPYEILVHIPPHLRRVVV